MRGKPWKPGDVGNPATAIPNLAKGICFIRANVVWAGDFTYIPWRGDFIYLATVIDVFTREIVGWHVGLRHTTDLVIQAFLDAVERTGKASQIFHSDQGSEYVSGEYELLLANLGVAASQSKKSSPWENGFQESFYYPLGTQSAPGSLPGTPRKQNNGPGGRLTQIIHHRF